MRDVIVPALAKKRIAAYDVLGQDEKVMVEFAAFCEDGTTTSELLRQLAAVFSSLFNDGFLTVGDKFSPGKEMRQKDLLPLFESLQNAGLLEVHYKGVSVSAAVEETAIRDAYLSGRSAYYLQLSGNFGRSSYRWYENRNMRLLQRQFRQGLYEGNETETTQAYGLILKELDESRDLGELPLAKLLSYSRDFSFLQDGPKRFLLRHLPEALASTQFFHSNTYPVVPPLLQFIERHSRKINGEQEESLLQLRLLLVGELWLCGAMGEAKPIIGKLKGYHKTAALGVQAFSLGKIEKSLALFEDALVSLRKTTRKKRMFFSNVIGVIFIYACFRLDSPEVILRAQELLSDAVARTNKSLYQEVFKRFEWLVDAQLNPETVSIWQYGSPWSIRERFISAGIADVLAKTLYNVKLVRAFDKTLPYVRDCQEQLLGTPHQQVVADLEALCRRIADTSGNSSSSLPAPTFDFYGKKNRWQLVLYNIARIGERVHAEERGNPTKKNERLSYRISFGEWDKRWEVTPYVQRQNSLGRWSKGKLLSSKRRLDDETDLSFLSESDERALRLLDREKERANSKLRHGYYEENFNDALYELAGHPYLFWEATQQIPVEIEKGSPQVEVLAKDDKVEIRMAPNNPCEKGFSVEKRSMNLLRVTRFSKVQRELLAALGKSGARFPKKAKREIAEVVTQMDRLVDVHSHVPNIGKKSIEIFVSEDLRLRLQPFLSGISAQFLTAPLGETGPTFVPGQGAVHVFATVGNEKRTTTRNLADETRRLNELLRLLGLSHVTEAGEGLYHFVEEMESLEFLSELENYQQHDENPGIVVEWPRGVKLSCSQTLFPKDFKLLVQKKRKWLQVNGELQISEDEVVQIATLVEGLDAPHRGYVRLKGGRFLRLSKSLRKYILYLNGIGEQQADGSIKAPEQAVMSVRKLADEAGQLEVNASWENTLASIDKRLKVDSTLPAGVKATFRDYQLDGYRWLHRLSVLGLGACLADDMGLGKTLQALALMLHRLQQRGVKKSALVVAPVSVIPGWFMEAKRFVPALQMVLYAGPHRKKALASLKPREVLVTSYGLLQRDGAALAKIEFDMIVLDEAQFIKNKDSARAKAAFKLQGEFKMVTTGTPVENRLGEFWSIFHFLNPGLLGAHQTFSKYYEKNIQLYEDAHAMETLRWMVKPFLLRRTKEETLDELPPKTEIVRYCEMSKNEAAFYELRRRQAKNVLKQSDSSQQMMELITALTTLRQAACHPQLIEPNLEIESAKLNCLKDILTELHEGGHQALIFSQFVKFLSIVRTWLDEQEISYQYMDGSCSPKKRTAAVDAFQAGKSDLFLISTRAGGFGLNLTAADYVVHLDPWWNPAVEDQASDRVHRIGQTRPVTVYKLVTKDTVEEKVLQMHGEKRALAGGLLEGTSAVAKLNIKELLALI